MASSRHHLGRRYLAAPDRPSQTPKLDGQPAVQGPLFHVQPVQYVLEDAGGELHAVLVGAEFLSAVHEPGALVLAVPVGQPGRAVTQLHYDLSVALVCPGP